MEIPPRARRRVQHTKTTHDRMGNTSACAEKSGRGQALGRRRGKYLRVRGEEHARAMVAAALQEIPPRARRRVGVLAVTEVIGGNTSACAEKS